MIRRIFFHFSRKFSRPENGFISLASSVAKDIQESYNVEIRYQCGVQWVEDGELLSANGYRLDDIPFLDYLPRSFSSSISLVRTTTGEVLSARVVVLTVPLTSLRSITFSPPLPNFFQRAAERCSVVHDTYAMGAVIPSHVVTRRVNRILSLDPLDEFFDYRVVSSSIVPRKISLEGESIVGCSTDETTPVNVAVVTMRCERSLAMDDSRIREKLKSFHPTLSAKDEVILLSDTSMSYTRFGRNNPFVLQSGTAGLLMDCQEAALNPWNQEHTSLMLQCAELAPKWNGMLEGALQMSEKVVRSLIPRLEPPKIKRNFARPCP